MRKNISVAGVARKGRRILVMHRLPGGSIGGLWEFPGGKCEPGETPEEALKREWLEETDFSIDIGNEIARGSFIHKKEEFELIGFEVILPDGLETPALREHDDWRWVSLDELSELNLVESDKSILSVLKEET